MGVQSRWEKYPATYREKEMKVLAGWITAGESGAVVGLPGTGRATLLNFLCQRPEITQAQLQKNNQQAILVPVDLNNLPNNDLATLYRVILRSFYEIQDRLEDSIQNAVVDTFRKYEASRDPFLPQSGLRELLLKLEKEERKVVLVMNRFDSFCQDATLDMTRTLRGLRDRFKDTLCYIMGMRQEVTYFSNLDSVKPLHSILDTHVLWVGPLSRQDAVEMIGREVKHQPDDDTLEKLISLTGGYPSLIRVVCHWWTETERGREDFDSWLLERRSVQNRLAALFNALTQEEQSYLRDVADYTRQNKSLVPAKTGEQEHKQILESLTKKGICKKNEGGWEIISQLMKSYPEQAPGENLGRIRLNEITEEIYQGKNSLANLTPLEQVVLELFIKNPQKRLTFSDLIYGAWDDPNLEGVTNDAVYQVIRGIRKKIEPDASDPRYVVNWRGKPEGGYQFFPEGRPN